MSSYTQNNLNFSLPIKTNKIITSDDFSDPKTAIPEIVNQEELRKGYLQVQKFTDKNYEEIEETANPLKVI